MPHRRMMQSELDLTLYMLTQVPFVKNLIEKNKKLKKENKSLKNLVYTLSDIQRSSVNVHKERKKEKKHKKDKSRHNSVPIKQEHIDLPELGDIEFVGTTTTDNNPRSQDVYVIKEEIIEQDTDTYHCDYCTYATTPYLIDLHKHKVSEHLSVYFNNFVAECIIEDTDGKIGYEEICNEFNVWFTKNTQMKVFPKKTHIKELMDEKYGNKDTPKPVCWKGVRLNYQMPSNNIASNTKEEWDYGNIQKGVEQRFHSQNESVEEIEKDEGLEQLIKEDESRLYLFKRLEDEEDEEVEVEEEEEEEAESEDAEEEEEEEEEVYIVTIKETNYYTTDRMNGTVYACVKDEDGEDDIGDEVGTFVNGKLKLNK